MPHFDSLIGFLDSRSFGTVWYWVVVIGTWSLTGRSVIGVPAEIVSRARSAVQADEGDSPVVLHLLDWVSLVVPQWQVGRREGATMLGVAAFALTSLAILGFRYRLELALASFLLLLPWSVLFWLRLGLARHLASVLAGAGAGEEAKPVAAMAAAVVRRMVIHRRLVTILSMVSVALTALLGAVWSAVHANGF